MSEVEKLLAIWSRTPKLLIVDDEDVVRMTFERLGRYYDLDITCATSPQQALALVEETTFDAIFVDMKFPATMDGMDVIRALNTPDMATHVVIMSGSINLHDIMVEANQLGIVSFMVKPTSLTTQLLTNVLRRLRIKLNPRTPNAPLDPPMFTS